MRDRVQTLNAQRSTPNAQVGREFPAQSGFYLFWLIFSRGKTVEPRLVTFAAHAKCLRPSSLDVERWTLGVERLLLLQI